VWDREGLYNNSDDVAGSPLKSAAKLAYYHCFALLYGAVGAFAQVGRPPWAELAHCVVWHWERGHVGIGCLGQRCL
jgi:hypothetical protein